MCINHDDLLEKIEKLRQKMTKVAQQQGVNSLESIILSQQLDHLLNIYDAIIYKDMKND